MSHTALAFLSRFFSHNLQMFEFMIWDGIFNFDRFFYILDLVVIFLRCRYAVSYFPFVNLLEEAGFQTREWNTLHTGQVWDMQTAVCKKWITCEVRIEAPSWDFFPLHSTITDGRWMLQFLLAHNQKAPLRDRCITKKNMVSLKLN